MAAAEKKFAFQLSAGLATNVLTESKYVKAGYIVVQNDTEKAALVIKTGDDDKDGVVVPGTPIYHVADKKSYRWLQTGEDASHNPVYGWVDEQSVSGSFAYKGHIDYAVVPSGAMEGDIYTVDKKNVGGLDVADGHNYFVVKAKEDEYKALTIADQTELDAAIAAGTVYKDVAGVKTAVTAGEVYSATETYYEKTIAKDTLYLKLMSGIDADTYIDETPTTIALGGIAKNATFLEKDGWTTSAVIKKMLHPYVPFKFESVVADATAGEREYGTTIDFKSITPTYTKGSVDMTLLKVVKDSDSSEVYSTTTPAASGVKVTFTTPVSLDGTANETFTVTLKDGTAAPDETTINKTISYTFVKHYYAVVLNAGDAIPTAFGGSVVHIGNAGTMAKGTNLTITAAGQKIVYLCPDDTKKQIQQYITGEWNATAPKPSNDLGTVTFKTESGVDLTYNVYSTNPLTPGTYQMRIA